MAVRPSLLIIFVTTLLGLGVLSVENFIATDTSSPGSNSIYGPELYGKKIVNTYHNENGRFDAEIEALESTHFKNSKKTLFIHPIINVANKDNEYWKISADKGELDDAINMITLSGSVQIDPNKDNKKNINIRTNQLKYSQLSQILYSDTDVTVSSPKGVITAVGMTFNLINDDLEFLSRVRATLQPIKLFEK